MTGPERGNSTLDADWLDLCRRAGAAVRSMLDERPEAADRTGASGARGEGGDLTLDVDQAAEDAVFEELEALGLPLTAVSEERGHVEIAGGGPAHVVVDPIDGSLNMKRRLPQHCLSIAVASGPTMGDVELGYVVELGGEGLEWWARRGEGAVRDGATLPPLDGVEALEIVGIEATHPRSVAEAADALSGLEADRLRGFGSMALSLCYVAAGQLDAMLSLGPTRSVDVAAAQLIVREAGGFVALPDAADDPLAAGLGLEMRSRVFAAARPDVLERLLDAVPAPA